MLGLKNLCFAWWGQMLVSGRIYWSITYKPGSTGDISLWIFCDMRKAKATGENVITYFAQRESQAYQRALRRSRWARADLRPLSPVGVAWTPGSLWISLHWYQELSIENVIFLSLPSPILAGSVLNPGRT